jgi:hypothetical protein
MIRFETIIDKTSSEKFQDQKIHGYLSMATKYKMGKRSKRFEYDKV